jgi:hypothetical protein
MCEIEAIHAAASEGESAKKKKTRDSKSEEIENKARQEGATEGRREREKIRGGVNGDGTKTDGGGGRVERRRSKKEEKNRAGGVEYFLGNSTS